MASIMMHLEFEVKRDESYPYYYYIRCKQHPEEQFMLDELEVQNITCDAKPGEWNLLTHNVKERICRNVSI